MSFSDDVKLLDLFWLMNGKNMCDDIDDEIFLLLGEDSIDTLMNNWIRNFQWSQEERQEVSYDGSNSDVIKFVDKIKSKSQGTEKKLVLPMSLVCAYCVETNRKLDDIRKSINYLMKKLAKFIYFDRAFLRTFFNSGECRDFLGEKFFINIVSSCVGVSLYETVYLNPFSFYHGCHDSQDFCVGYTSPECHSLSFLKNPQNNNMGVFAYRGISVFFKRRVVMTSPQIAYFPGSGSSLSKLVGKEEEGLCFVARIYVDAIDHYSSILREINTTCRHLKMLTLLLQKEEENCGKYIFSAEQVVYAINSLKNLQQLEILVFAEVDVSPDIYEWNGVSRILSSLRKLKQLKHFELRGLSNADGIVITLDEKSKQVKYFKLRCLDDDNSINTKLNERPQKRERLLFVQNLGLFRSAGESTSGQSNATEVSILCNNNF